VFPVTGYTQFYRISIRFLFDPPGVQKHIRCYIHTMKILRFTNPTYPKIFKQFSNKRQLNALFLRLTEIRENCIIA